jgi:hypothetical protein
LKKPPHQKVAAVQPLHSKCRNQPPLIDNPLHATQTLGQWYFILANNMAPKGKATDKGKGKGKAPAEEKGTGKVKPTQQINVRHILVNPNELG